MTRLYLVRHGEAAAGFGEAADPGLTATGRRQAEDAAQALSKFGAMPIFSSPLARARETAAAAAGLWNCEIEIARAAAEIPSPGVLLTERRDWLLPIMTGTWRQTTPALRGWRQTLIDFLVKQESDCVIFSHFVAINAAVGAACDRDEVVCFKPANGSITILNTVGNGLDLIQRGKEAETKVN